MSQSSSKWHDEVMVVLSIQCQPSQITDEQRYYKQRYNLEHFT